MNHGRIDRANIYDLESMIWLATIKYLNSCKSETRCFQNAAEYVATLPIAVVLWGGRGGETYVCNDHYTAVKW